MVSVGRKACKEGKQTQLGLEGIRMVSKNFEKNFLTFLGLGTNVVKVSSVNSELLFQWDTLTCWDSLPALYMLG